MHSESCFLTLTYNDENLPSNLSLNPKHFQLFMKKLRKTLIYSKISQENTLLNTSEKSRAIDPGPSTNTNIEAGSSYTGKNQKGRPSLASSPKKIRYFHCGEYGTQLGRPHYHAIMFGYRPTDGTLYSERNGNKLFETQFLTDLWGHGFVTFGEVTFESCAYVARYITKKITGDAAPEHYAGRHPEYCTMSRRPGIGAAWYEKFGDYTHTHDFVVMRGKKNKPPRFYDNMLKKKDEYRHDELKTERRRTNDAKIREEEKKPGYNLKQKQNASDVITKARMIARKGDF